MLNPYRRHTADCKHADKGMGYTNCRCPIWVYGQTDDGRYIRQSLKTRDWARAAKRIEQLNAPAGSPASGVFAGSVTPIEKAIKSYCADCERRHLAESTLISYRRTFGVFLAHCKEKGIEYMNELTLDAFSGFHAARKTTANSQRKEIEHLRAFCAFCLTHKWIDTNFAKAVKPPKDEEGETLPFDRHEVARLIAATERIGGTDHRFGGDRRSDQEIENERLISRALVLLLLYSGLRISDAMQLRRERLNMKTGKLLLRMMKTRHNLYLTLQREAISALAALPRTGSFFFWYQGEGRLESHVERARQLINRIGTAAGVADVHPHRFRDTFAKELLVKGATMRTVQLLLGHKSIRTTEKHYAAFVPEHQEALDIATATLKFTAA